MRLAKEPKTPPAIEPVTLDEAKKHLNVSIGDDDALIQGFITAARQLAENMTGRQMVTATWVGRLDGFPADGEIPLPKPPLQSVTSIKYFDLDGVEQTLDTGVYLVDADSTPGRILLSPDQNWPGTRAQANAITIEFVAGWPVAGEPPSVATTPEAIKSWIKLRVAGMYEFREPVVTGPMVTELKRDFVDGLLDPYALPEV
jgi:uncharacterized phiE125 gp8 family phage protein